MAQIMPIIVVDLETVTGGEYLRGRRLAGVGCSPNPKNVRQALSERLIYHSSYQVVPGTGNKESIRPSRFALCLALLPILSI